MFYFACNHGRLSRVCHCLIATDLRLQRSLASHDRVATHPGIVYKRHTASRFPWRRRRCVVRQRLPWQRRRAEGVAADDELYLVGGRLSDELRHLVAVYVLYLGTVYLQFNNHHQHQHSAAASLTRTHQSSPTTRYKIYYTVFQKTKPLNFWQ